jgi:hypothetical protein
VVAIGFGSIATFGYCNRRTCATKQVLLE